MVENRSQNPNPLPGQIDYQAAVFHLNAAMQAMDAQTTTASLGGVAAVFGVPLSNAIFQVTQDQSNNSSVVTICSVFAGTACVSAIQINFHWQAAQREVQSIDGRIGTCPVVPNENNANC